MLSSLTRSLSRASSHRSIATLVVAESSGGKLGSGVLSTITAASKLKFPVSVLVTGKGGDEAGKAAAAVPGVSRVFVGDVGTNYDVAENATELILSLHAKNKFSHIISSSCNSAKNILPRLASKLDVAPITDVTAIIDDSTFERPMYAGNVIARVRSSDSVKIMTVRPTSFEKAAETGGAGATVEAIPSPGSLESKVAVLEETRVKSERPELGSASKVVSGGRAMKSGDNFKMLYELADKMGAAVGASRAAVDAGYVTNDLQVGQTGKVVAPQLYMAVGISGAIQHLAGMKDSKYIVAINKDAEAPIVQVADYSLIDDPFKAVPEFSSKIKA